MDHEVRVSESEWLKNKFCCRVRERKDYEVGGWKTQVEETITLISPVDIDSYGVNDKCDIGNWTNHLASTQSAKDFV